MRGGTEGEGDIPGIGRREEVREQVLGGRLQCNPSPSTSTTTATLPSLYLQLLLLLMRELLVLMLLVLVVRLDRRDGDRGIGVGAWRVHGVAKIIRSLAVVRCF